MDLIRWNALLHKWRKLQNTSIRKKRNFPCFLAPRLKETRGRNVAIEMLTSTMITKNRKKLIDYCHFKGKFIGYAHSECKLKRTTLNYATVINHNMMYYDLHNNVKSLHSASQSTKNEVTATNEEKFIALNFGVFIETRNRKLD